jgi:hypothetical protein
LTILYPHIYPKGTVIENHSPAFYFWTLAAGLTMEHSPNGKPLADPLQLVVGTGSDEDKVSRLHSVAVTIVQEYTTTSNYHV